MVHQLAKQVQLVVELVAQVEPATQLKQVRIVAHTLLHHWQLELFEVIQQH